MTTNDTYLAVFLGSKTSPRMKAWMALPEAEGAPRNRRAWPPGKLGSKSTTRRFPPWAGPLGKTKKITGRGIEDVSNEIGAFMVVRGGIARGGRQAVRDASAFHDLSGRVRGDHAGSADTRRLIGINVRFVNS